MIFVRLYDGRFYCSSYWCETKKMLPEDGKQQFKNLYVFLGAGNCLDETKYKRVCKEACVKATSILKAGGTTLDACEAAIVCLENSGNTNAGEI